MWGDWRERIKDTLFPVACIDCKREGQWWCKQCREKVNLKKAEQCPVCGVLTLLGRVCGQCRAGSSLDGATALFDYIEGRTVARLIQAFKYNGTYDLVSLWKEVMRFDWLASEKGLVLMPVPLHARRERERGFNQAMILAQVLSEKYGGWVAGGLKRVRYTKQQAKLNRLERKTNIREAFEWGGLLVPERVFLVDDVFTTGATMQECAKILRENGAKMVWGLTIARG